MSSYYNGTSAYKFDDIDFGRNTNTKNEEIQHKSNKKAKFVKRLIAVASGFGVFALAIGILFVNALIIEKSTVVNDMQKELTELTDANNQIVLEMERNLDLNKIEEIAINELGMKRPDKYQVIYVNVEQNDYAEVIQEENTINYGSSFAAIGSSK